MKLKECPGQYSLSIGESGEADEAVGHSWSAPDLRSVAPAAGIVRGLSALASFSELKSKLTRIGKIIFKCCNHQSIKHSV